MVGGAIFAFIGVCDIINCISVTLLPLLQCIGIGIVRHIGHKCGAGVSVPSAPAMVICNTRILLSNIGVVLGGKAVSDRFTAFL